jgi:hypothetical protein
MRRSILRVYARYWDGAPFDPLTDLWAKYLESMGCMDALDLAERFSSLYGPPTGDAYRERLTMSLEARREAMGAFTYSSADEIGNLGYLLKTLASSVPEEGLGALPDEEFLMALEVAMRDLTREETQHFIRHINGVFETVGVAYCYGTPPGQDDGVEFYRTLDPRMESQVVEPVLRALADARLTTSDKEFRDGLRRVAKVDASELDDAVLDFGRAVTEALHALAEATCGNPRGAAAGPVFARLRDGGILPAASEWLVLSANRLRNPVEHQRGVPSNTDPATAQAAMGAAATAITYLATFLPPVPRPVAVASTADDDIPF